MKEAPPGSGRDKDDERSHNRPDILVEDGPRRISTWMNDGEYGPLPSSTYDKAVLDNNNEWKRTHRFGQGDYLIMARMLEKTHDRVVEYKRDHQQERSNTPDTDRTESRASNEQWHDEDSSRSDIKRKGIPNDRQKARTRRRKPRDRTAR